MIPTVDPSVKYVGSSWLRGLNVETMKSLAGAVVVQNNDSEPLVVILPYETYIALQQTVRVNMEVAAFERIEKASKPEGQFRVKCIHSGCRGSYFQSATRYATLCEPCREAGHLGNPRECQGCFHEGNQT